MMNLYLITIQTELVNYLNQTLNLQFTLWEYIQGLVLTLIIFLLLKRVIKAFKKNTNGSRVKESKKREYFSKTTEQQEKAIKQAKEFLDKQRKKASNSVSPTSKLPKKQKKETSTKKEKSTLEEKNTLSPTVRNQKTTPRKKKKKKEKSAPVVDLIEKESSTNSIFHIGYKPTNKFHQDGEWKYAVVKMPKEGSVIRQPVKGKLQLRGYKEEYFQNLLEENFSQFSISGNSLLSTGNNTRPYEPDICMEYLGNGKNIYIDIEIDEPYGAISRNAIHAEGDDERRDYYFTDRGWIIIRFAEIQVHNHPYQCLGLIGKVLNEIAPEIYVPKELLNKPFPIEVEQWDTLLAQKWEGENAREEYLGHEFGVQDISGNINSAVKFTDHDLEVEKKVESTLLIDEEHEDVIGDISFSLKSSRDKRIQFYPNKHLYLVDGIKARSVTEIVGRFFPEFDTQGVARKVAINRGSTPEEIIKEWGKSRDKGTFLHKQIENYFNDIPYEEPPEFSFFQNFLDDHSDLEISRTEWRVFDDQRLIAGTIDCVSKNSDGTYSIYDWKRSKNVVDNYRGYGPNKSHPFGTGFGKLQHVDSTAYNKYCIQQGVYKRILETYYDIEVSSMYIVVIHPRYSNYYKFEVQDCSDEVEFIMNSI